MNVLHNIIKRISMQYNTNEVHHEAVHITDQQM